MRLKETQIKRLNARMLNALKAKQLVKLKKAENLVLGQMEEIVVRELRVEDEINRDAQKLVEQYAAQGGDIDRQKLFLLIKKQLIKDRGVVL